MNRVFNIVFSQESFRPRYLMLNNYNLDDYYKHMKDYFGHDRKSV